MCKETDKELKAGEELANKLVDHVKHMGAESCKIPAKEGYTVSVYLIKNDK